MNKNRRQQGVVLALVLVLALLLSAAVITFTRNSVVDALVVRNRNNAAEAETLARGGVAIATGLALEELLAQNIEEDASSQGANTLSEAEEVRRPILTARFRSKQGDELQVEIQETGARLNLNALVDFTADSDDIDQTEAEEFLVKFFEMVIDEIRLPPGEKFYDPRTLAENLIDYIDPNEMRTGGRGGEDDYYQRQIPPYRAANRPLLSVEELGMVEGFNKPLVDAVKPYVTVYPLVGAQGINLNAAPPHVLKAIYHGTTGDRRLISGDTIQRILKERQADRLLCDQTETNPDRCTALVDILEGSLYPPVKLPSSERVFKVRSAATVGEIERSLETVIDLTTPTAPRLLFWRFR